MAMVSFMAGACISTADFASSYMAPSTMSVQWTSSATGRGSKPKRSFGDHRNKTGAGLEIRIVELAVALILLEVGGIGGGKKSAFVVIEPPGDFGRTGILEIDDGILVAVELVLVEKSAGTMQQAGVDEVHIAADSFPVEAGEQGGRARPVKTLVVIKHPHSQISFPYPLLRA